ncbi:MAG: molybdopterin-dependent oxidoreductase, partial [Dehalococcoidia bacterium]|nr:molybdopterin-dependent oxidoreductase [Dehalococcoidia bacterium]
MKRSRKPSAGSQPSAIRTQGLGIGCTTGLTSLNLSAFTASGAFVKLNEDGRANLLTGAPENGQGTETMLAQICAEELGLGLEDIVVTAADTDVCPHDIGSYLMALTFVSGNAVKNAAADAKKQLLEIASGMLEAPVDKLEARNRRIYIKERPERGLSFAEVVRHGLIKGVPVLGKGHYMPHTEYLNVATGEGKFCPTYTFSSQVSEVEVDTDTGEVKVLKSTTAHDCGFAINPMDVEGQIHGCVATSQGLALSENVYWEKGKLLNPDFLNYGIPCSLDINSIKPIIVESMDPEGPFGGKDAGETPTHIG